jgi:hypothetical protein
MFFQQKLTTFAKSKTFIYKKKILAWLGACVRTRMLIVQEKSDLVIRIRIRNVLGVHRRCNFTENLLYCLGVSCDMLLYIEIDC